MKNEDKKLIFTVTSLIILTVAVSVITNFRSWKSVKGLAYPTTTSSEINSTKRNKLLIQAYESKHGINKEDYEFKKVSKNIKYKIGFNGSFKNGSTDFPIESNKDLKNIILIPNRNNFVGWSGCDAVQESTDTCLVSVIDNQTRKIEAHYSKPKPNATMQLFSISNNSSIGGSLNESWTNVKPELAYKAAYIDVSGPIPSNINELDPKLELSLGGNPLGGSIPKELGELSNTDYIGLQKTQLGGSIPKELGGLSPIYFLAYDNNLSGEIPKELGNMGDQVERFELHNNQLSGTIPASLTNLGDLTPSELRLQNNNLEKAEIGLISDSNWQGINFYNNNFGKDASMSVLQDASNRSGTYIDFCSNPTDGGTIYYGLDGKIVKTDIENEVNAALEAGWDVYIPIQLKQKYKVWAVHRGGPACKGSGNCFTVSHPCGKNNEDTCYSCSKSAYCKPPTSSGYDEPPTGSVDCAKLTGPIRSPSNVDPNSEGIPADGLQGLRHVYHYNSCKWWIGPGKNCKPICKYKLSCGSPRGCPVTFWDCFQIGWESVNQPGEPSLDSPFRGTCSKVQTNY